jgi:hypothetical protein
MHYSTLFVFAAYFFFPPFSLWESALPAAVLLVALVRPSLKTFEAAEAAAVLVTFLAITFKFSFQSKQYRWIDSCLMSFSLFLDDFINSINVFHLRAKSQ